MVCWVARLISSRYNINYYEFSTEIKRLDFVVVFFTVEIDHKSNIFSSPTDLIVSFNGKCFSLVEITSEIGKMLYLSIKDHFGDLR